MEVDTEERDLEKLVFGDNAGFNTGISGLAQSTRQKFANFDLEPGNQELVALDAGLEDLDDDDIFMVDTAGADDLAPIPTQSYSSDGDDTQGISSAPAWHDSDDEKLLVSLATNNRLRKLRRTEDEDVITGKEYMRRLRQQYIKLNPMPDWANEAASYSHRSERRKTEHGDSSSDEDSDGDVSDFESSQPLARLLRSANGLVGVQPGKSKKRKLRPEVINIQKMKHICNKGPSAITSLQVHPSLPLILASGPSGKMDLYHFHNQSPEYYELLTSLVIKRTALTTTAFHPKESDPRIFLSARRRYFHVWNVATGRVEKISRIYGQSDEQRSMERFKPSPDGTHVAFLGSTRKGGGVVNILSMTTLQWVAQARIESRGGIAEFEWWRDGSGLCIVGKSGGVTEWSLAERKAVAQWQDEGAVGTTVIALGGRSGRADLGGDAWVAVGSSSGIVNVYSRRGWFTDPDTGTLQDNLGIPINPKPARVLDQLTTPTSHLSFSPDGQLLVMASRWKKDALRLIHLPSCAVYKNWPTSNTPFGRISAVCWGDIAGSPRLVVGNEAGRLMCWEIGE